MLPAVKETTYNKLGKKFLWVHTAQTTQTFGNDTSDTLFSTTTVVDQNLPDLVDSFGEHIAGLDTLRGNNLNNTYSITGRLYLTSFKACK